MGLFSKKTVFCERCGKEFQVRLAIGPNLCPECLEKDGRQRMEQMERMRQKKDKVSGYVEYAKKVLKKEYSEEQLDQIDAHRTSILEKYRMTKGISRAELAQASENYRNLTDEQAEDVLLRVYMSSVGSTMGASYTSNFFLPTEYEKVVVDAADVFAVGFTRVNDPGYDGETLLCVVFTNDQYIPAFTMVFGGELGFFELLKSKKGRKGIVDSFSAKCPNLTYPVQELKLLKKQIKSEGTVKGNVDKQFVLEKIDEAFVESGIFNTKKMSSSIWFATKDMLDEYGYIVDTDVNSILKMDRMFNRNYWNKQLNRLEQN